MPPLPPAADSSPAVETPVVLPMLRRVIALAGRGRQFASTVFFAFAVVGLQLGQGILLARLLGPQGRGEYATATLYAQLLLYVGLMGGLEVVCRAAAADHAADDSRRAALRRSGLRLALVTGSITAAVAILCNVVALPPGKRFLIPLGAVCALGVIGQHVMLILTGIDRGMGHYAAYNYRRLLAAATFPALIAIAWAAGHATLPVACGLFVLSSILAGVVSVGTLRLPLRGPTELPVRQLLRDSRPYGLSMLITDLFERLDLLLVLWLTPLVVQGYYAAMVPVVYPLTVIPNTMGIFLFNVAADQNRRLRTTDVHRILGGSLAIQAASTVAFMMLVGPVVRFVYGEEFAPAIEFAMWLAPAAAIKGILQGLDSYVKGRGRPLTPLRCRLVATALMLAMTAALVGRYGAVAIAAAALAGQVLCLVWLSVIVYADVRQSQSRGV